MERIKLGIFGLSGRMGKAIQDLAGQYPEIQIIGGTSRSAPELSAHTLADQCDVLVDFSHPDGLNDHLSACTTFGKPLLIGTTGLSPEQHHKIQEAAQIIPLVCASNTSIGISVLQHLVTIAAQQLDPSYDIEIFETHHRHKIDAPSGTALTLGQAAASGRQIPHIPAIRQSGQRLHGEIGYACHRGGAIFGEHTVRFLGDEEVIELKHTALSRHLFARGALKIALKLIDHTPGLYTVSDLWA